jgi:hypothetical protein
MSPNQILGIIITIAAVLLLSYLVFWSRRAIDRIADKRLGTIREILKDLDNES